MTGSPRTISVVMGTYNGELYVREQLRSIVEQTRPPIEIIVSDDASNDRTCDIVESVAAASTVPIVLHRNHKQLGFADNFLGACDYASGRYIAFSDQDDRWHPEKLERGLAGLMHHDALLCSHLVGHIDADGRRLAGSGTQLREPRLISPAEADPWGNFYGFTMLFERSLLEKIPYSERGMDPHTQEAILSHDRWVWFLASTFGVMVELDERLADYRQHGGQLYGGLKPRTVRERLATQLIDGEDRSRRLASVAHHRALLLETGDVSDPESWPAAAQRWQRLEENLLKSAELYGQATRGERLGRLSRNMVTRVYGSCDGGLGRRRLLQDVTVVLARLLNVQA